MNTGRTAQMTSVAAALLLAAAVIACVAVTASAHAELKPGQDKDNYYPWEKLLSAQEMLIAQRDEPSPMWLHPFQALDSLASAVRDAHVALYNITTPILPALVALYAPATQLLLTPYDIAFGSPHRTLRQLTIAALAEGGAHHMHGVALVVAATTAEVDRRVHDRAQLRLLERVLRPAATVLLLQPWQGGVSGGGAYWAGGLLLPGGCVLERAWGWDEVERTGGGGGGGGGGGSGGGWRLSERWRGVAGELMTVWQLRVRADVESAEWTEEDETEHHGVTDSRGVWQRAVEQLADAVRPNITWTPYRRINRI